VGFQPEITPLPNKTKGLKVGDQLLLYTPLREARIRVRKRDR
jgi:hypothetical protein